MAVNIWIEGIKTIQKTLVHYSKKHLPKLHLTHKSLKLTESKADETEALFRDFLNLKKTKAPKIRIALEPQKQKLIKNKKLAAN